MTQPLGRRARRDAVASTAGQIAVYLLQHHDLSELCTEIDDLAARVIQGDARAEHGLRRDLRALDGLLENHAHLAGSLVAPDLRDGSDLREGLRDAAGRSQSRSVALAVKGLVDVVEASLARERLAFVRARPGLSAAEDDSDDQDDDIDAREAEGR